LYEHSIEVLLPYVKYCLPNASIVPILVGGQKPATATMLTRSLDVVFSTLWKTTLFILSTNLSGLLDTSESSAQGELFLALIQEKNGPGILEALNQKKISACGAVAAAALMDCRFMRTATVNIASRGSSPENGSGKTVQYAGIRFE
jgi:AmmeMemoRadiSam system protein B